MCTKKNSLFLYIKEKREIIFIILSLIINALCLYFFYLQILKSVTIYMVIMVQVSIILESDISVQDMQF